MLQGLNRSCGELVKAGDLCPDKGTDSHGSVVLGVPVQMQSEVTGWIWGCQVLAGIIFIPEKVSRRGQEAAWLQWALILREWSTLLFLLSSACHMVLFTDLKFTLWLFKIFLFVFHALRGEYVYIIGNWWRCMLLLLGLAITWNRSCFSNMRNITDCDTPHPFCEARSYNVAVVVLELTV